MNTNYIGNQTAAITNLPYKYDEDDCYGPTKRDFTAYLKADPIKKFKYVLAITANKYQKDARTVLKNNNFREIVEFYSSHNEEFETLSLWVKNQKDYKPKNLRGYNIHREGINCTVSFNRADIDYRFVVTSENPKNKAELKELEKNEFVKVRGFPIYYRVEKGEIVGEKI